LIDQELFAKKIREAGASWQQAEIDLAKAEAAEKRIFATLQLTAQIEEGHKTIAAQSAWADQQPEMESARIQKGVAKGSIAAAKANYLASEVEFKTWQTQQASERMERRVYGS